MVSEYLQTECNNCETTIPRPDIDGHEFDFDDKIIVYRTGLNYGKYEPYCSIKCLIKDKIISQCKSNFINKLKSMFRIRK